MGNEKTDPELMMEFRGCSTKAFEELFYRLKDRLYNFLFFAYLKDSDLSNEAVQNTMIRLWKEKKRYEPGHNFQSWIFTIARNNAIDILRERNRNLKKFVRFEPQANDDGNYINNIYETSSENPEERIITNDMLELLEKNIGKLPPQYRQIFTLRYLDGLSFNEIVKITGMNRNTLTSYANRGLKILQDKKIFE
jgi:RNA polymerase sigma-70 factor, ECF subfamily